VEALVPDKASITFDGEKTDGKRSIFLLGRVPPLHTVAYLEKTLVDLLLLDVLGCRQDDLLVDLKCKQYLILV